MEEQRDLSATGITLGGDCNPNSTNGSDPWLIKKLLVGQVSNGYLSIQGGSEVSADYLVAGSGGNAHGSVVVTGGVSKFVTSDSYVGWNGTGEITVNAGATWLIPRGTSKDVTLGHKASGDGRVLVTGKGTKMPLGLDVIARIGEEGTGNLTVADGALLIWDGRIDVGHLAGSEGTITVNGIGSEVQCRSNTMNGILRIGVHGQGTLAIENGGKVSCKNAGIGDVGKGTATVIGKGTIWALQNLSVSAGNAQGVLTISNSGVVRIEEQLFVNKNGVLRLKDKGQLIIKGKFTSVAQLFNAINPGGEIQCWDRTNNSWKVVDPNDSGKYFTGSISGPYSWISGL